ncbi:carboxymuconolactone decarboxylase family protein [Duganella sp. LX20W]|uniref:Carboxymuconolactone decarboxylase family protein n=1 Tax=Rugamonas brunnea TaxID=2758569 RepID=A0A7W2ICW6_9BURK|nr:carboxymuconolactone decarboxylase family protein [Rugamonas brunnea]MBA5638683.1 carboxymuconolactone decarboxylase family protein [Rugamonas brunnea]
MTTAKDSTPDAIHASYQQLLGSVPDMVSQRQRLARATGRIAAVAAIEEFRDELIHRNPLDRRTQQLVHFAMLIARGEAAPARLHAAGAVKAGASLTDLQGVVETAAVVCGMPGAGLAVEVIASLGLIPSMDDTTAGDTER